MHFTPTHQLHIIREEEFPDTIKDIEKQLEACRHSGRFVSFDGNELFYEYFLVENSIGTIVLVHGLSEFTKKFYELTWYFLNQSYNVVLYDQRGHGLSCRLTDVVRLIHVDHFEDYAKDLAALIDGVVIPAVGDSPLYLYAHSMGGAVAMFYLAMQPDTTVKRAVLSSPLIAPCMGILPFSLTRFLSHFEVFAIGPKKPSCQSAEFNPKACHTPRSPDISRNRFEHNMNLRRSTKYYQTTPQSAGWNREALDIKHKLLGRQITHAIRTPMLLLSAEKDTVVRTDAQQLFAERCDACQIYTIKNARHSLFTGSVENLEEMLTKTLAFFSEPC